MLKINVKNVVEKEKVFNTLRLTVETMNGDADGNNTKTLDVHESELQKYEIILKSFIEYVNAYMKKSHNSRCEIDQNSSKFFGDVFKDRVNEDWYPAFIDIMGDLIPGDPTVDYQFSSSYQEHKFTWFDSESVEHECELVFEK